MISKHWVSIDYNTSTSNNGSNDEQSTPIQCLVTSCKLLMEFEP